MEEANAGRNIMLDELVSPSESAKQIIFSDRHTSKEQYESDQ